MFQFGAGRRGAVTQVFRRLGVFVLLSLAWVGLLWPASSWALTCRDAPALAWQSVVPGVAAVHGHWPSVTPAGRAHVATTVVLGQGQHVTVVDPGPTERVGRALQQDLACRKLSHKLSSKGAPSAAPRVVGLINTHAHAEQVLANGAFGLAAAATSGTRDAMRKRCPDCLAALRQDLGATALRGTRIVVPTQVLVDGQSLQAGGRAWRVREMRHAHSESDLVLWSEDGGIVLAGGLVDGPQLPVLAQGSVQGWLQALAELRAWQPQWLVGQQLVSGPGQVQAALQRQQQYLCGLVQYAWQGLDRGWSEAEAVQDLPPPQAWAADVTPTQARTPGADQTPKQSTDLWTTPSAKRTHPDLNEAWQNQQRQQHVFNQLRAWREVELSWMDQTTRPSPWPGLCASTPDVGR
ncbi:MBL fold metallo-hydrolase [Limnohabitans sp. T6-5]|uniref:MBL fold metallo-hydrolase n=1 Tax=Limnohabitans sp. T6-5 TaxID=1100724 RepID=UPI001304F361|nr:MBL fold metallo-hydrolase [Limnohabitans sp. T6-5]